MLDKEKLLSHLHREEDQLLGGKILDKIEMVLNRNQEQFTDFLNPYQRKIALSLIKQINGINFIESGGYKRAERKRIALFPDFLFPDHIEVPITILKIDGNFQFQTLTHKDFLGALMSLGIKRKKLGDILVLNEFTQIIVAEEIEEFIEIKLKTVHEVPVTISKISSDEIEIPAQNVKEIRATVPSMRLDAVASAGFGDSRNKISRDIKNEKVKLNWKPEKDPAQEVEINDLISIRNRGRVEVVENQGKSNRGRIKLLLKRFT
ncbi:MAG: photosystem II S4 domain protein [bacterium]